MEKVRAVIFMSEGSPAACQILHRVCKLEDRRAISAYLFQCGLDDQNPEDWGDVDSLRADGLVMPIVAGLSSDEEEAEGETEEKMEEEEEEEAVFIRGVNTNEDPPNAHQAQHRPVQATSAMRA